ncbi:MAG TPA: cellulase family glycosylhydrolase [Holophagaceae bacterium]|nr:cellulase family glycosylhydrolase [Holophagaceae bacterium]
MPRSNFASPLLLCLFALIGGPACGGGADGSPEIAAPESLGAGHYLPAGPLSTKGNQIVDRLGTPVRIASVGWFDYHAGGVQGIPENVAAIKAAGFNCIRLRWVNATMAQDQAQIDTIVDAATSNGIKIVLVNQTNEPGDALDGWGAQQKNGLWYDLGGASDGTNGAQTPGTVTEAKFVSDWQAMAQHYKGNTTIIGYDLRNEPLAYPGMCTWGDGDPDHDLRLMYQTVGNAILAIDPGKLIICEGPQNYGISFTGKTPAPWGDLSLAAAKPVALGVPHKVVYSIHDYPYEIAGFSPDSGATKIATMNATWGYLVARNLAPVWVGEMGSSMQAATDADWARTLVGYLNGQEGANGGPTFTGNQQGIGSDWWAWGYLWDESPDGVENADGSLKADQEAVWSQLLFTAGKP